MQDVTFTLKDVLYIIGLLGGIAGGYFSLKAAVKGLKDDQKTIKEDMVNIRNGKRAMKKELLEVIKEKDLVVHERINKTQEDLKEFRTRTDEEFKTINSNMSDIKNGVTKIETMITQLINK